MGELGALFNPGMRHELEERQSKAARREEEGNARDADLRIDLESGVAVINIPGDEHDLPADEEQPEGEERRTVGNHAATGEPAQPTGQASAEDQPAPDPVLKPRGKRGFSASSR